MTILITDVTLKSTSKLTTNTVPFTFMGNDAVVQVTVLTHKT